jgi:hypothetical protein
VKRREEIVSAADRVASGLINAQMNGAKANPVIFNGNLPLKGVEDKGKKITEMACLVV